MDEWLVAVLGAPPARRELFETALTHRSAGSRHNERLEFLGDSVLSLLITETLYRRFPQANEGSLSRLRSRLVSAPPLAEVGLQIGIGPMLRLGSGELKTGGFRRESILADAVEALIGASYLDGGLEGARALVLRLFHSRIEALEPGIELKDPKTRLQELLQGRGEELPVYVLESTEGEPHAQTFRVRCEVRLSTRQRRTITRGSGSSRRHAEQQAADMALQRIEPRAGV